MYVTGEAIRLAKFSVLTEHKPTNVAAPYFIKFQNHEKLRGVRAQKTEVSNGRLRWLPTKGTTWYSVDLDHVEFVRISVNLDIEMDFDVEF